MELISGAALVLSIVAIIKVSNSESRIKYLENKLQNIKTNTGTINIVKAVADSVPAITIGDEQIKTVNQVDRQTEDKSNPVLLWIKDNWLMKLGVFLVLLGFVWALNYAYSAKYITETAISIIGLLVGAAVLSFGFIRMKIYVTQGSVFMLLGTALVILTAYFMKQMKVIDSSTVLAGLMLSALMVTSAAAVLYARRSLSVIVLFIALMVPIILDTGSHNYNALYAYLMLIVLGTIWVLALTGWRILTLMSLIGVCIYSSEGIMYGFGVYTDAALLFAFAFAAVFFITNTVSLIKNANIESDNVLPDIIAASLNAAMISTFVLSIMDKEGHVMVLMGIAIAFSFAAFAVYKAIKRPEPFMVYSGISGVMFAYITYLLLDENIKALAAAYTLEVLMLSLVTYILSRKLNTANNLLWLLIVPLILIQESIWRVVDNSNVLLSDYILIIFYICTTTAITLFYRKEIKTQNVLNGIIPFVYNLIWSIAMLQSLAIIWGACRIVFAGDGGIMLALIIYAIIGIPMYIMGKNREMKVLKVAGAALIGLTTLWLMTILIAMGAVYRIAGFIIIGVIMLSSAFFLKKKN